jgi:3-oxoacyl-[acyl-carrier protein] reductase
MNKRALITGGSRGIGAGIVRELATSGVLVTIASRKSEALESLLQELPGNGHSSYEIDLQSETEILPFLDYVQNKEFDIVVNNAGGNLGLTDPLDDFQSFKKVLDFNLGLAVDINARALPGMIKRGWGRITHISSISALENQGPPQYCAAKAALNAYIRSVGRYVAADGVVVTGVMPGAVMTAGGYWDEVMKDRPEHGKKFLNERMAIKRFGEINEISSIVAFLVSDSASFMTGSVVLADGGQGRTFQ